MNIALDVSAEPVMRDDTLLSPIALAVLATTKGRPVADRLAALVESIGDALPHPAGGNTLARWRVLAQVARDDLSLAKLYEAHADALAIMRELAPQMHVAPGVWNVWAAEAPRARLQFTRTAEGIAVSGTKAWCSGAEQTAHALVTGWIGADGPFLASVDMRHGAIQVVRQGWNAVGMAATATYPVMFEQAHAMLVGSAGAYLGRAGFWQGAIGVAACWYGGALALAEELRTRVSPDADPIRMAHLGAVDVALARARAALQGAARWVDANPAADAQVIALRTRAIVEASALEVLDRSGRALGASAYCLNGRFAQCAADLPVYLRQSHADHDLAQLGAAIASGASSWTL